MYFHFHSVPYIFFFKFETSSLTHGLFRSVLFSFQVFGNFPVIDFYFVSLWLENTFWYDFNSFRFVDVCFMARIEYILWVLEKNVYSSVVVWSVLFISTRHRWLMVLLNTSITLLIFLSSCSINHWDGVLKSSTIIVLLFLL